MLIGYFLSKPTLRLHFVGIFRVNSTRSLLTDIDAHLSFGNYSFLEEQIAPTDVANMLKNVIKNLKTPLFPYRQYFQIGRLIDVEEDELPKRMKDIVKSVYLEDRQAYNTLKLCFDFFQLIVKNVEYNKMTAYNLSVTISPYLF